MIQNVVSFRFLMFDSYQHISESNEQISIQFWGEYFWGRPIGKDAEL